MRYVAFLDILGFKSIIKSCNDIEMLGLELSTILQSCIKSSLNGETTLVKNNPNLDINENIKVYQFSDSIILYTEDDNIESFNNIVLVINKLVAQSAIRGFPLRGAIVRDELYVNPPIIIGEALIKAYQLEGLQEWSGVIIDESCYSMNYQLIEPLLKDKLIIIEEVPLKTSNQEKYKIDKSSVELREHMVINWPQFVGSKIFSIEEFDQRFCKNLGQPTDTVNKLKKERTFDFLKKNYGCKSLPNFQFEVVADIGKDRYDKKVNVIIEEDCMKQE